MNSVQEVESEAQDISRKGNFKTSHGQSATLHSSENAWKPLCKTQQTIAEKEKLKRNVQAVLNKLTFQKFKILLAQLKKLDIDSVEEIDLVVDLIYENAIYEPYFCVLYANLCKHLAQKLPFTDQSSEYADFCSLLLLRCQKGFGEGYSEFKQNLQPQDIEEKKKLKTRWIGNIRFMGELYKFNLIQTSVIQNCIETLLDNADEDSLECFCWLMKTAGKELETSKDFLENNPVDEYFAQIQKIVLDRMTSTRIRFMLQDIIDLRKNNWVPRRVENIPRTIDEIRREAELEAQKQMKMYQRMVYDAGSRGDDKASYSSHCTCLCDSGSNKSSRNVKVNFSGLNLAESKSETPDEVKSILYARCQKGRKGSYKNHSKRKPSHAHPENKPDHPDSASKSGV